MLHIELPNVFAVVHIPELKFVMNILPLLPSGSRGMMSVFLDIRACTPIYFSNVTTSVHVAIQDNLESRPRSVTAEFHELRSFLSMDYLNLVCNVE